MGKELQKVFYAVVLRGRLVERFAELIAYEPEAASEGALK